MSYNQGSYNQGFYNQESYKQGFLQPGVLTARGSYNQLTRNNKKVVSIPFKDFLRGELQRSVRRDFARLLVEHISWAS